MTDDRDPEGWRPGPLEPQRFVSCLQHLGFYATVMYRLSRWLHLRGVDALAAPIQMLNHSLTGAELSRKADLGPGLRISHPQGIFIGPGVVVGFRSTLSQGTCLSPHLDLADGAPTAGSYLTLSPGAKVFGGLSIGDRVWIGPNSVAYEDLEDDQVVLGVPCRPVPPDFEP